METLFNFQLSPSKTLSNECIDRGLHQFSEVCNHVKNLSYGRNSNRSDFILVLTEQKGTCSTKHAFLAQIVVENKVQNIELYLGLYKMNGNNTTGVSKVLSKCNLHYIPEAHAYLKCDGKIYDFTRNEISNTAFEDDLLYEEKILPEQVNNYKVNLHKTYIKQWIIKESIPYSFEKIWQIREECISCLSQ